jgi:hypothetical protein
VAETTGQTTAVTKRLIDNLKRPFMQFAGEFKRMSEKRTDLAPKFMTAFAKWVQDNGGGTFVSFVQFIDPTVPLDRDSYRVHASYMAADWLRRQSGQRRDQGANRQKPIRSNVTMAARLIATLLPLIKDHDRVWEGFATEFGLTKRQKTRLMAAVASAKPIIQLPAPKHAMTPKIVHVAPEEGTVTESLRQTAAAVRGQRRTGTNG